MTRYGMAMDVTRCNGCYNCFLACRDEFTGNDFLPYSVSQPKTGHFWMRLVEKERGRYPKVKVAYTAHPCMQCENPACVIAAEDEAVYKRDDGIVIIDPVQGTEQPQIVDSCPYRAIFWNEERRVAQKCTFCAHLLDAGYSEPRCSEACPTNALVFGDLDDPESEVSRLVASGLTEAIHPEYGLGPAVTYIALPKRFVAGAVVFGDTDACGEGAQVTLQADDGGRSIFRIADNYGDFEFEGLAADRSYRVTIAAPGYQTCELMVRTNVDVYAGDIVLHPLGGAGRVGGGAPPRAAGGAGNRPQRGPGSRPHRGPDGRADGGEGGR